MSLIPDFEIGIWNAWILALVFLLLVYIPVLTFKDFKKKMGQGEHYGKIEVFMEILFYVLVLITIFLPLKLRTAWFYTGFSIYLVGLIFMTITIMNVTSTPLGKPLTKGLYRFSRNPAYLSQIVTFLGIGTASASWLYLFFSVLLVVMTYLLITIEERVTLEKLGESYREYMNRTPRWLGMPKS